MYTQTKRDNKTHHDIQDRPLGLDYIVCPFIIKVTDRLRHTVEVGISDMKLPYGWMKLVLTRNLSVLVVWQRCCERLPDLEFPSVCVCGTSVHCAPLQHYE